MRAELETAFAYSLHVCQVCRGKGKLKGRWQLVEVRLSEAPGATPTCSFCSHLAAFVAIPAELLEGL